MGWVAYEILLSALGLGLLSILYSLFYCQVLGPRSQVPGPRSQVPGPSPKSQSQSLVNNTRVGWTFSISVPYDKHCNILNVHILLCFTRAFKA